MKPKIFLALIVAAPLAYAASLGTRATGQDAGTTIEPSSNQNPNQNQNPNMNNRRPAPPTTGVVGGFFRPGPVTWDDLVRTSELREPPGGIGADYSLAQLLNQDQSVEVHIRAIFEHLPSAPDQAKALADARKAVSQLLQIQFSLRQHRRDREIAEIEERVKILRDAMKKRADAKQQIVERRLNDLFSDAEGLGWGEVGATPGLGRRGMAQPGAGFGGGGFSGGGGAGGVQGGGGIGGGSGGGGMPGGGGFGNFGGGGGFAPPGASTMPTPATRAAPRTRDIRGENIEPRSAVPANGDLPAEAYFNLLDKDKDGQISEAEWGKSFLAPSKFKNAGIAVSFPLSRDDFLRAYPKAFDKPTP